MVHLVDRNAFWVMVTLCNCRVTLLKKIITVLEMKPSSACFNELRWLLNIFLAKLILVKITYYTACNNDYNNRGKTGKQIF